MVSNIQRAKGKYRWENKVFKLAEFNITSCKSKQLAYQTPGSSQATISKTSTWNEIESGTWTSGMVRDCVNPLDP